MSRQRKSSSKSFTSISFNACLALSVIFLFLFADKSAAQETAIANTFDAVGTVWLMVAAALVFFMNAGFAMLETGFCRTRNAVNVLAKNLIVFCIATFAFWLFGFRYMFGDSTSALFGQIGFLIDFPFPSAAVPNPFPAGFINLAIAWPGRSFSALFFFQLVFAGTAATIVSGAVAERIKFWAFILFSFLLVGFIYPIAGYWVWGGGWLAASPIQFRDFAGSTVVHSIGGVAALIGALLVGPREGRFGYQANTQKFTAIEDSERFQPYNLSLATLGCLILWLGWFGFNGGSTASLEYVPHILTTTFFSAAAGGIGAVVFSPFATDQKARLYSIINGILGGLVGITASSAYVSISIAVVIGAVSGLLVLWAESCLNNWRIDDPVGAIPVHLVCGGWGTLAVGLFASSSSNEYQLDNYRRISQILFQAMGWISVSTTVAILSFIAWAAVGLVLYASGPSSEKISKQQLESLKTKYSSTRHKNISWLTYLLHISRLGIRVPVEMEEKGGAPAIIP